MLCCLTMAWIKLVLDSKGHSWKLFTNGTGAFMELHLSTPHIFCGLEESLWWCLVEVLVEYGVLGLFYKPFGFCITGGRAVCVLSAGRQNTFSVGGWPLQACLITVTVYVFHEHNLEAQLRCELCLIQLAVAPYNQCLGVQHLIWMSPGHHMYHIMW